MAKEELRGRATWQDYSGVNAAAAETSFFELFQQHFEGTNYQIRSKPKDFANVYVGVELSPEVLGEIFCPEKAYRHGFEPDYAIDKHDHVENAVC